MRVLDSKISIPKAAPVWITRPRLLERLNSIGPESSVVLQAPAGYGKTALVAQYLSDLPQNMKCWITLEKLDGSPRRFARYLVESLSGPIRTLKDGGLIDNFNDGSLDVNNFVDDFCYFLEERKGPPVWLVLDNWELTDTSSDAREIVERLINYSRVKLRIMLTSRVLPSLHFKRMQEAGKLTLVGPDELRFTREELAQAVRRRFKIKLNDKEVARVYELTRGWCVSVGFAEDMIRQVRQENLRSNIKPVGSFDPMEEYIGQEVLASLHPELRSFLSYCSILDVISEKSCRFIDDDRSRLRARLDMLRGSMIPFTTLGQRKFRLHPLMREAFQRMLRDSVSGPELKSFFGKASAYFLESGDLEGAIDLLLEVRDYDRALQVIGEQWYRLIVLEIPEKINSWLSAMPAEKRDSVLYIKARTELLAFRGDFKRIVDLLEGKVEHSTLPNGDPALGFMWFAYNHCRLLTGQLDSYDAIRCDWNSFNERRGPFDDSVVAEIEASLGYAAFLELRFTAAYDHLANTVRLSTGDEHEKMFKYRCGLEWIRHECGGSHVARQNLEDLLKESEYRAAHALAPMGLAYLAWIATCTGEYNVARLELDRLSSLTLTSKLFPNTFMMYIDLCSGISRFYCGDIADGLQRIERAADRIKGLARLEFLLATNIYRYFGELAGINCKYSGPAGHSKDKRDSFEMLYVCTLQAYRLMKSEEYEKAIRFARRIWTGAEKGGALPWIVTGCFFESYAQFKTDNLKESKELLRRGIGVLDEIQWKNYPLANSEVTSFVVTRAVAWGIKSEILEKLSYAGNVRDVRDCLIEELTGEEVSSESKIDLVRFAIGHRVPGLVDTMRSLSAGDNRILTAISEQYLETHKEMDLPQLRVSALGSSSAIIDSRKVKFHRVKSKHLFFWLLLEYPNSLHEETIMEYLWPDSPPAKSRQNLQTTVSALRRSLDPDSMLCPRSYVLYDANQYSIDIPAASHVDIHTFEKSYHHIIEGLVDAPNLTEFQEREIRHTLDLCQGSLLPEMRFESFVETRREESSRKYFDLLEAYLGKMFQQEKYQAAESYLERGLQIEPLWANGVRLAMEMYSRSSRTLYALKAYRKYEAQLKSEVGVEPDEGLQQLLEKLRVS